MPARPSSRPGPRIACSSRVSRRWPAWPTPSARRQLALAGAGRRHAWAADGTLLADVRIWVGILLIVGGVLYYQYWQTAQQTREIADTDAAHPDLRPAHRGLRRPGIPELAQALRALICGAAFAGGLQRQRARGRWSARPAIRRPGPSCPPPTARSSRRSRPEWNQLDAQRKQKWLGIAKRYPTLSPTEQQRVQEQMHAWAQLTPGAATGGARTIQVDEAAAARATRGSAPEMAGISAAAAGKTPRAGDAGPARRPAAGAAAREPATPPASSDSCDGPLAKASCVVDAG